MMTQTPGRIFLADQRGLTTTRQFQRFSTLNFGSYAAEHREPLGRLYGLNDETLAGGQRIELPVPHDSQVLLLPVTGSLSYSLGAGAPQLVQVEELLLLQLPAGSTLVLHNPYPDELIGFLHLWLAAELPAPTPEHNVVAFDFASLDNQLQCLLPAAPASAAGPARPFALSLGRFDGRREAVYAPASPQSQVLAFVLAGAFELEGRLLHAKDSLLLWNATGIELEALSNNTLLLLLELLPE